MSNINAKILIVDDNPTNIQVVGNILTEENYDIAFAQSGKKALDQVQHTDYDLILLDVMMPEEDGFEVCKKLKSNPETKEIPVVFLTAKSDIDSIIEGLNIGGIDYINKPFIKEELLARVKNHIKLKKTQDELKIANNAKDKFFSIIAHDLKSPIGAFKNITDVLYRDFKEFDNEDIYDFIAKLNESSGNIYKLLDDLLNWSRTQNNKINFEPTLILIKRLVNNNIELLNSSISKKELNIVNSVDTDLQAYGDLNMVSTIIRNLISNSIKFTNHGGRIEIGSSDRNDDMVVIWVKDNGVGISESDKEKLFQIGTNYSKVGTEEETGTGLGLILCKEFVVKHGGKIWVESELNNGSTFYFTIPKIKEM